MSTANGLQNFAIHRNDSAYSDMLADFDDDVKELGQAWPLAVQPQKVNPESAAVGYLNWMIQSPTVAAPDSRYPVGEYLAPTSYVPRQPTRPRTGSKTALPRHASRDTTRETDGNRRSIRRRRNHRINQERER